MMFVLEFLLAVSIYFSLYLAYRKFVKKEDVNKETLLAHFKKFGYGILKAILILAVILISFIGYQNYLNPVELKTYTLVNEKDGREVKFQEMAHLASPSFYQEVQKKIIQYKQEGGILYFEGVKPAKNPINQEKFNSLIGIKFSKDTYTQLNSIYGLKAQNNSEFWNLVNNKDYDADMSFDDIIEYFEKVKHPIVLNEGTGSESQPIDISEALKDTTTNLAWALPFIREYNQSLINFVVKHSGFRAWVTGLLGKEDFFDVIIKYRSEYLAKEIIKNKQDKKIFVTYGMEHYSSFLEYLNHLDGNNWKLKTVVETQLIEQ